VSFSPSAPVTADGDRCGSGQVVLTATATGTIKWYDAPSGGALLGTGSSFSTPSISSTTTFYALCDNGCISSRVPAVATINTVPAEPVTTGDSRCGDGSLTLTATAADPVKWYDAPAGGTLVGSANTFNTPVLSATATYYVLADNGPCKSNRIAATATINPLPPDPVVPSTGICGAGTVVLNAASSDSLTWYDAATGGNVLATGPVFTTPVLASTTTYYIVAINALCTGNVVAVDAVINAVPPVDLGPDTIVYSGPSYTLDAGAGFTYQWSTSEITQTISPGSTGNYCVTITDANNCTATDCAYLEFTVGVHDPAGLVMVSVYPNPSHGKITVDIPDSSSPFKVSIADAMGNMIYTNVIYRKADIDLSNLAAGVYHLAISDGKKIGMQKIVVQ
jgi:hypothetical protein